ncbi:MAG: hypothetical protein VXY28_00995, partial [Bacteroidota bacterium]|nr:hypothetical protein [Bacteroidota bacterium]
MIGGNFCLSQYLKNTNLELVESQVSFSNYILSKCNSTDYSTDSLTLALHRNDDKYRQFCKYFSSKYDPIFFNNLTYSYKRISYLIDEKLEVIYWADKYNVYLRGIRNRLKQERNENIDLLASNKEDFAVSKQSESLIKSDYTKNNIKSEAVHLNGEWIEESSSNVLSQNRTAEYEAQRIRDQEKKKAVIARQIEAQRISDSLKELEQLAKFEEQRLAKESAERLLAEELKRQRISDSLAKAEQLAKFEEQRLAKESAERLLAEELK